MKKYKVHLAQDCAVTFEAPDDVVPWLESLEEVKEEEEGMQELSRLAGAMQKYAPKQELDLCWVCKEPVLAGSYKIYSDRYFHLTCMSSGEESKECIPRDKRWDTSVKDIEDDMKRLLKPSEWIKERAENLAYMRGNPYGLEHSSIIRADALQQATLDYLDKFHPTKL